MATNTPAEIGGNDPSVLRQIERQNTVAQTGAGLVTPPSVSTNGNATSNGTTTSGISLAPIVTNTDTLYPQSTAGTTSNAVTITSSYNNQSGDVTTVYTSATRIVVNPINQTINQYTSTDSGVSQIVAGTGVTITSTGASGTGVVTINSTGGGANYTLPTASSGTLGGVKVGSGLSINGSGVLSTTVGNIATTNYDGNAANVLHGDGSWSADVTNYGNSNVVSLLGAFGSNTIVTTGIITADGANLSNVPYANLTGAPALGNITSINLDGSTSNVLYGNGVFAPGGGGSSNKIVNGNSYANIANADGNLAININNNLWTFSTTGLLEVPGSIQNPNNYNQLNLTANAVYLSSEDDSVTIVANNAGTNQYWTFGADGNLTFPGSSLTIGNLAGAPTVLAAADLSLQIIASGGNGVADIAWFDDVNSPSKVAAVVVNNPLYVGDSDVGIVTGDILGGGGNTYIWNFGNDGTLSLPIQGNIVGLTPDNSGYMKWVGNSSGDGSGYTTLRLIPDETLVAGDQYLIIDPTGGGHIHIRAGGTQDNSYGQLYLGGEQNFVRVIDNQGLTLQNQLVTQTTNNYSDPTDFTGATWFTDGGSYYIQYTSTNAQLDVDPFQDINNIYITWNSGANSTTLTYGGGTYNLGGGVYKVQVNEAPTTDPTAFDTLAYTLNITATNTLTLDGDGFNVTSPNDVNLAGNGYVEITNLSNSNPVTIRTDALGNGYTWAFNSLGQTVFPTLTVDLHNGGNQNAQTLQFGDPDVQAVITGPTPGANTNAQRLIIQGQRGNGTGEGGDVYLWGGDSDVNGGDIKIYAGDADVSGSGGYINIDGGSGVGSGGALNLTGGQSSGGLGGQISITPGYSGNGNGATLTLNGGQGTGDGGPVNITAGYGSANGGAVTIQGGQSALGLPGYGNVLIGAGASTWTFNNEGNLVLAGGNSVIQSIANSSLDPLNPNVSTMVFTPDANYNGQALVLDPTAPGHIHLRAPGGNIDEPVANIFLGGENSSFEVGYYTGSAPNVFIHSNSYTWTFDNQGALSFPRDAVGNTDPYLVITGGPAPAISSVDASLAGPANLQLVSDYLNLTGYSGSKVVVRADDGEIMADANMVLTTNAANVGNEYSWTFATDGSLTLPGNLISSGASPAPSISGFSSISTLISLNTPVTYSTLTAVAGSRAFINDANLVAAGNFGQQVSGGGANSTPVWSDGTNWYVG